MKKILPSLILLFLPVSVFGGDFYFDTGYIAVEEDNTDGDGFYANFGYMFKGKDLNHCIQLEFGSIDMGYKEEAQLLEVINDYYNVSISSLPDYEISPYLVSYRCIFPLMKGVHGYAKFGGGIVRAEILGESDTSMAVEVGLGVELMANESFGIHIEYDFMKMDDLDDSIDGENYTLPVGDVSIVRGGVVYYF